jgi:amino acid transporter
MILGQGSGIAGGAFILPMILACALNMITAASICELGALMPNLTGGLAQYTLAGMGPFPTIVSMVGGYLFCNSLAASAEGAMFGASISAVTGINPTVAGLTLTVVLIIVSLNGVDMFAKVQNVVAFSLIGSMAIMGIVGALGLGTGATVEQPLFPVADIGEILPMTAMAFWLFLGVEFVVPLAKNMKNPKKDIPRGMFLGLGIILLLQILLTLGFHKYTPWGELAESASPHIFFGTSALGGIGTVWMALVAVLAAVSTLNTLINSLSQICLGMSKINMLPAFFQKTNRKGASIWGVLVFGGAIFALQLVTGIASASNPSAGDITFLILTGSVFWMVSYLIAHLNVLNLRRKLPKAPRSFRTSVVFAIVGIAGSLYMIANVSENPMTYIVAGIAFVALGVYAFLWIKFRMKVPVFKSMPLEQVMATENELYYITHVVRPKERRERERALEKQAGRDGGIRKKAL